MGLFEHNIASNADLCGFLSNKLHVNVESSLFVVKGDKESCMLFGFIPGEFIVTKNDTSESLWLNEVYLVEHVGTLHLSELVYGDSHEHCFRLSSGLLLPAEEHLGAMPKVIGRVVASIIAPEPFLK